MKIRIISAIIMLLIGVPILIVGGALFKVFALILGVCSTYELLSVRKSYRQLPIFIRILSYAIVASFIWFGTSVYLVNYELIYKLIAALFLLYFLPIIIIDDDKKYDANDAFYAIGSTIFLAIAFNSCVIIMNKDLMYLIYVLLVTMMTDTFAYFTGYFIGKHKLCEKISPKKTWEGAIGGTLIATIIASTFYIVVLNPKANDFLIIFVTLILSILGQYGDLFFSSIKRHFKVKDYSNLIPGHGGILDRLDSVIFVILTYILFMNIL